MHSREWERLRLKHFQKKIESRERKRLLEVFPVVWVVIDTAAVGLVASGRCTNASLLKASRQLRLAAPLGDYRCRRLDANDLPLLVFGRFPFTLLDKLCLSYR